MNEGEAEAIASAIKLSTADFKDQYLSVSAYPNNDLIATSNYLP